MKVENLLQTDCANITVNLSIDDLQEFAKTIVKQTIEQTKTVQKERLIQRKELGKYIPLTTLTSWKNKGFLTPVFIGGKSFYKFSDLEAINIHIPENEK